MGITVATIVPAASQSKAAHMQTAARRTKKRRAQRNKKENKKKKNKKKKKNTFSWLVDIPPKMDSIMDLNVRGIYVGNNKVSRLLKKEVYPL